MGGDQPPQRTDMEVIIMETSPLTDAVSLVEDEAQYAACELGFFPQLLDMLVSH